MKPTWEFLLLGMLLLSGCAVKKPVVGAYRALYCEKRAADGKCEKWAMHSYECVRNEFGDCTAQTR